MNHELTDEQILLNVGLQAAPDEIEPKPKPEAPAKQKSQLDWSLPGFGGKSRVLTSFGVLPIEALRRNDPLKTQDGKFLKVTWVDTIKLDPEFLVSFPHAQPVLIKTGSVGRAKPSSEMLVSPAQVIQASAHHGGVSHQRASEFLGFGGISRKPVAGFTYYIFGCAAPCSVCVDGIWCEIYPKQDQNAA